MNSKTVFVFLLIFCFISAGFIPLSIEKAGMIGNASADYVDASNNTNCIEEDPLVPGWSKDVRLRNDSTESAKAVASEILMDNHGNTHVVWLNLNDYALYYTRSTNKGISWAPIIKLTDVGSGAPTLAVNQKNIIILGYVFRLSSNNLEIYIKRSTTNGTTWGSPIRVTSAEGLSTVPRVTAQGDMFYLVWRDQRDGSWQIYFSSSGDGGYTWTFPIRVSNTSAKPNYPVVAVNEAGVICIVWEETTDGDKNSLWSCMSFDGGETLENPEKIVEESSSYREASLIAGKESDFHLIWSDYRHSGANGEIFYKRWNYAQKNGVASLISVNNSMPTLLCRG